MSKTAKKQDRKGAIIFSSIIMGLFFALGAYFSFVVYPRQMAEHKQIGALPLPDLPAFQTLPPSTLTCLTGTLEDNEITGPQQLVTWQIHQWEVEKEDDEIEGDWYLQEENWPALMLAIKGGKVTADPGTPDRIKGPMHELIKEQTGGMTAEYNGMDLSQGSLRTRGVRNKDLVTMVGKKTGQRNIKPDIFYLGTKKDLLDSLSLNARFMQIFGFILQGIAIVVMLIVFLKK